MKAVVAAFNQEKALIVQLHRLIVRALIIITIITTLCSLGPHLHELLVWIPVMLAATHSASVKTENVFQLAPLN